MNVTVEISVGEFFDKITILEIKKSRIQHPEKLENIKKELDSLNDTISGLDFSRDSVKQEVDELRSINETLWDIEDDIRAKESEKDFGEAFISLARAVYHTNDKRSEVKRKINLKLGSSFIEEKSYEKY